MPIGAEEARGLLAPFERYSHLLLAVSGGGDSLAMMVLGAAWAAERDQNRPRLSVATIDHALRAESADEAAYVGHLARGLGLEHAVLQWTGDKPSAGLQEAAREARYALLAAQAKKIGADGILLAHHANDQAETVLMRLCAGSGLTGLAGMEMQGNWGDMPLLRPFLAVEGARLRATLDVARVKPVEDPSNINARFTRVRFRQVMPLLEAEGLDPLRLGRLARRMRRAELALQHSADTAKARYLLPADQGFRFAPAFWSEPEEIILRVVGGIIGGFPGGKMPDLFRLEEVVDVMRDAHIRRAGARRTLGGTLISTASDGTLFIRSEGPRGKPARD